MSLLERIIDEKKSHYLIITALYVLLSIYLYNKYGIKLMNDSPRFLGYAANLSEQGIYFDPLNFWYISYVFFVYFSQLLVESHWIIIYNQYLFGLFATYALYAGLNRLTGDTRIGFLGALIFIFFPDNLMWHSYVLTESFYCSILCVTFYSLVRFQQSDKKLLDFLLIGIVLLITFFSKPTSPALFIALATPFLFRFLKDKPYRIWKFSGLIISGLILLVLANKIIHSHHVLLIYTKGDIIFAMHELPNHPDNELMTIDVPEEMVVPETDQALMVQMGQFVVNNPIYFLKLFTGKVIMYITHVRPYWSIGHNLMVALFTWLLYFFGIRAMRKKLIPSDLTLIAIIYFLIHTMVIGITWADWDGRFFVPVIPLIVVLGTIGLADKLFKSKAQT